MAFMGMRGTGDWVKNERPLNWRETILKLYPNGAAPLTAMLSKMGSSKVDDPTFNWWTQKMSTVQGPVTAKSFAGAAAAGATGTVTVGVNPDAPAAHANPEAILGGVTSPGRDYSNSFQSSIRVGHQILLCIKDSPSYTINAQVTSVAAGTAGATTVGVKLLEAAPAAGGVSLAQCNYFKIIGNINAEGAAMPDAISWDPVQVFNYTQIFRTPLSITRTAKSTHLRTGDQYQKMKAEALEQHSWEIEQAFLFGQQSISIAANGKPQRTTLGFVNFIKQYAPANVFDYQIQAAAGSPWSAITNGISNGQKWLDGVFEQIFRYGVNEKLMLCGSGAVLAINQLGQVGSITRVLPGEKTYGLRITEWITPFGSVNIMTHPLMSNDPIMRNTALILEPRELEYRFIDDTKFFGEKGQTSAEGHGSQRIDGTTEEFLTEAGLMFGLPQKCGVLYNLGTDKAAAAAEP